VPVRDTQTDRQTNLAENKGPSGLQSGQQTPLTTSTSLHYAMPVGKDEKGCLLIVVSVLYTIKTFNIKFNF